VKLSAQAADVALVGAAGSTGLDVSQRVLGRANTALVRVEQRRLDVGAAGLARVACPDRFSRALVASLCAAMTLTPSCAATCSAL